MCNGMSSKECIFTGKKVPPNLNVQWNVFKRVYFYWEKSTPQFKIELISREYFCPCGSKFFPGKYYSGSTFFPGNYYSGSNFFSGSNYLRLHRHRRQGQFIGFHFLIVLLKEATESTFLFSNGTGSQIFGARWDKVSEPKVTDFIDLE